MVALGIVIDRKCNIRCGHCCFSSTPQAEEHLTDEQILRIVKEGCETPAIDTISLSGGEALLRKPLVLEVLRVAKSYGKAATLVTNGFWGQNKKRAEETLFELKEAGLCALKISFDDFHQDLLKVEKVKNILDANLSVRIPIAINVAVSKNFSSDRILAALGESLMGVKVIKFPIQRVGAAEQYPEESIIRRHRIEDNLTCPGFEPTYHYDGKVYPCCSPTVFTTGLTFGKAEDLPVERAVSSIERNLLFAAIRQKGFKWLFERCIEERVLDISYIDRSYVDACEMCQILFSNPHTLKAVVSIVSNEYTSISK